MLGGCLHHQHHHDEFPNTKQKPWNEMGRGPSILTFFFISFIESFFLEKWWWQKKKKKYFAGQIGVWDCPHNIFINIYIYIFGTKLCIKMKLKYVS